MDWERMIPGHPGPGGRLGTKQDVQDLLTFLQDASAEIKTAAQDGKCWDTAEKEFKLPKYESWPGYANGLPLVARRYCGKSAMFSVPVLGMNIVGAHLYSPLFGGRLCGSRLFYRNA